MSSQTTRWNFEAVVEPTDKVRLRGFIRNEITYYNALLNGFQSRLRTMPEVFDEVDERLLGEIAAHGYNLRAFATTADLPNSLKTFKNVIFDADGNPALSERILLFIGAVSVNTVLHPETRRAMALEFLAEHKRQAAALSRTVNREDQVLSSAVELLHPHDGRLKRHLQIPARAVVVNEDGRSIRSAYTGSPVRLKQSIPDNIKFNVVIMRDEDGTGNGDWNVELRQDKADYLVRLSDAPVKKARMNAGPRGHKKHSNV